LFTVGIIGRPNVGKSTLFNRIAGRRVAIVENRPGVTRDRIEIDADWIGNKFKLIDTAGYDLQSDLMKKKMQEQFKMAIAQADIFILVADSFEGVHPLDEIVIEILRKENKPFIIAVNKADTLERNNLIGEFYSLGTNIEIIPISALHGKGVDDLLDHIITLMPIEDKEAPTNLIEDNKIKITVIGRPNVGKSSLINAWLDEERVIVTDIPGTTRDSIDVEFKYKNVDYILTDTAGIRKKSVMFKDLIERFGYYRSIDSMERSDIAVAVIDGADGLNERDVKVIADAWEKGRPVILAINKWDLVEKSPSSTKKFMNEIDIKLQFLNKPPVIFISSTEKKNIFKIFDEANILYEKYSKRIKTSKVNEILAEAIARHQAPAIGNKRLKFFYMTQVSTKPPYFVTFVNYPKSVHFSYERFIVNVLREKLGFNGIPIRLSIREKQNRHEHKRR